jgi:hypothetical protein
VRVSYISFPHASHKVHSGWDRRVWWPTIIWIKLTLLLLPLIINIWVDIIIRLLSLVMLLMLFMKCPFSLGSGLCTWDGPTTSLLPLRVPILTQHSTLVCCNFYHLYRQCRCRFVTSNTVWDLVHIWNNRNQLYKSTKISFQNIVNKFE